MIRLVLLLLIAAPTGADPNLAPWFQSLRNPVTGNVCCGTYDGHQLRDDAVRVTDLGYEIRIGDAWIAVPPETVLERIPNPTGRYVAFYNSATPPKIYCFIRPSEV